ncbi:MAG TPA: sigma factor-like helix-turn-helix DNA-binding protein [Solirubrobacteraceae bacterium]|nr:sigma factor-like helix-turn-helix DNA-binding protein [Solirubrobacteraceae bacterium]
MPSLDSLPGDQRAVLQLVLGRGRSYDEIARMLSMNASAVRERAVSALRALGPYTTVDPDHQALIGDYLLGQASDDDVARARDLLADSPSERAWARVVASELASVASGPLPEIPLQRSGPPAADAAAPEPTAPAGPEPTAPAAPEPAAPVEPPAGDEPGGPPSPPSSRGGRRVSKVGGAIIIGLAVLIAAAVVVFFVTRSNSSKHPSSAASASTSTSTPAASASSTTATTSATTTSSTSSAKVVAQINLSPPSGGKASKAAGIAEILNEGSADGVAIVADNVPANTTHPPNAYAVWLYNSPSDAQILGFVNPGVGKTGRLSTAGGLPSNASHYKKLIVTLETSAKPKQPGTIVLQGTLTGL